MVLVIFDEFWKEMIEWIKTGSEEKTVLTITGKSFIVGLEYKGGEPWVIPVPSSSGEQLGSIPENEFKGAWDDLKRRPPATRFGRNASNEYVKKDGGIGRSEKTSYTTALIKRFVGSQDMV